MRVVSVILTVCMACTATMASAQALDRAKIAAFLKTLPDTKAPEYSETEKLALAADPLGCEGHPQAPGVLANMRPYLWHHDGKPQIADGYFQHRAFYGCFDWHSSVNSMWTLVTLIKSDPTIAVAPAIRTTIENHIQKANIDGEMNFFTHLEGMGADYEKPYGYAWLLKLDGALMTWNDPEGRRAAVLLQPMADWFEKALSAYLNSLNYAVRVGVHPNTALDMGFALDYTRDAHDTALEATIDKNALRLFGNDKHCPTAFEFGQATFASPCLAEAALMGRVLTPEAYAKWLTDFLPPVYSLEFAIYSRPINAMHGTNRNPGDTAEEGLPNAHLIGLNFQRAADLMWIANSLPAGDPRIPAYRKLADFCGNQGYAKIGSGGYLGTHWLASYALMYENQVNIKAVSN